MDIPTSSGQNLTDRILVRLALFGLGAVVIYTGIRVIAAGALRRFRNSL